MLAFYPLLGLALEERLMQGTKESKDLRSLLLS